MNRIDWATVIPCVVYVTVVAYSLYLLALVMEVV